MITINLQRAGNDPVAYQINPGSTLANLFTQIGETPDSVSVNGEPVESSNYKTYYLNAGSTVYVTRTTKLG